MTLRCSAVDGQRQPDLATGPEGDDGITLSVRTVGTAGAAPAVVIAIAGELDTLTHHHVDAAVRRYLPAAPNASTAGDHATVTSGASRRSWWWI